MHREWRAECGRLYVIFRMMQLHIVADQLRHGAGKPRVSDDAHEIRRMILHIVNRRDRRRHLRDPAGCDAIAALPLSKQLPAPAALPHRLDVFAGGGDALQHRIGFGSHARDGLAIEYAPHEDKTLRAIRLDIDARYVSRECRHAHRFRRPAPRIGGAGLTDCKQ